LDILHPMAASKGTTVAQLALAWLFTNSIVTSIIVGAKNTQQLDDNLQSGDITFTAEELNQLDEVSRLTPEYPGWILDYSKGDRTLC
jgi:aryl-alcohol dehydrogenase-like predicted oxidoreductase